MRLMRGISRLLGRDVRAINGCNNKKEVFTACHYMTGVIFLSSLCGRRCAAVASPLINVKCLAGVSSPTY